MPLGGFKNGLFTHFYICFGQPQLSFCFRLPFVCLSFCFRFAFVRASETKRLFVFGRKSPRNEKCFRFGNEKPFRFRFSFARLSFGTPRASCVRTTNRLMPRGPNSGSRPRSDGGRPQREAAARSPHGRPRPGRSPRAARSPRIGAPTSAPSTAEQQPLARIVDFGEQGGVGERREDFEHASAQQRRRRRVEDEDGRTPRTNARWHERWRMVMVDIAMGTLPPNLNSRGARSAPLALDSDARPHPESLAQTSSPGVHSALTCATCHLPQASCRRSTSGWRQD